MKLGDLVRYKLIDETGLGVIFLGPHDPYDVGEPPRWSVWTANGDVIDMSEKYFEHYHEAP